MPSAQNISPCTLEANPREPTPKPRCLWHHTDGLDRILTHRAIPRRGFSILALSSSLDDLQHNIACGHNLPGDRVRVRVAWTEPKLEEGLDFVTPARAAERALNGALAAQTLDRERDGCRADVARVLDGVEVRGWKRPLRSRGWE